MIKRPPIDELVQKLKEALPQGGALKDEAEAAFRATLSEGLSRMNLVTREEFDVQAAVLARTRARLEALEARLAELEGAENG